MEQQNETQITIPPTPRNRAFIVTLATEDPELHAAMVTDGMGGWDHSPHQISRPNADDCPGEAQSDEGDTMTGATARSELDARILAVEERMDRRIDRMEQSEGRRSEAYRRAQEARDKLYNERFEAMHRRLEDRDKVIDAKLDAMSSAVQGMADKVVGFSSHLDAKVTEVKNSNRNTVLAILGIAVATVLGLWGANSTIVGSASGIFDSGRKQAEQERSSKELLLELKSQASDTKQLLEQIKAQQEPAPQHRPQQ